MARRERDNLLIVLERTHWRIKGPGGAAELLGVNPTTLQSRIKKMGLRRETAIQTVARPYKARRAKALSSFFAPL